MSVKRFYRIKKQELPGPFLEDIAASEYINLRAEEQIKKLLFINFERINFG